MRTLLQATALVAALACAFTPALRLWAGRRLPAAAAIGVDRQSSGA